MRFSPMPTKSIRPEVILTPSSVEVLGMYSEKIHTYFPLEMEASYQEHESQLFLVNVAAENPTGVVVRKLTILQVDL